MDAEYRGRLARKEIEHGRFWKRLGGRPDLSGKSVLDVGSGRVTFVGTSGMTLNGVPSLVSSAQWSAFSIFIRSATTAAVIGRLA